ncbi:MAG TPA: hypothetical protein VM537_35530 [Anaerolineae bacterium]|nr:hypothetical protein [Anaerolineae bacterium]
MPKARGNNLIPISVLAPPDIYEWLKREAQAGDRSLSKQVIRLIRPMYERKLVEASK